MVAVTYATLHTLLHKTTSDITQANTEAVIDQAINALNLRSGLSIPNLVGGTVTLNSAQTAAVMEVSRIIYYSFYRDPTPVSIEGVSSPSLDLASNSVMAAQISEIARNLRDRSERTFLRT